jgi:hypothetical protein
VGNFLSGSNGDFTRSLFYRGLRQFALELKDFTADISFPLFFVLFYRALLSWALGD